MAWFRRAALAAMAATGLVGPASAACPIPPRGQPLPREAVAGPVEWAPWHASVNAMTERLRHADVSNVRLLFLGDSITAGWDPPLFQQFYGQRAALNLGIGGDATQGMLWRLENGHWPAALRPELIVLLVGTNNIGNGSRAEDVAVGISTVIGRLQRLSPNSRILLLGLLPRGATAADPARAVVTRVNQLIAGCAADRRVSFSNPGLMMVDGDGKLPDYVSFDTLHLTMVGYAILAAGTEAAVRQGLSRP